MSKTLEQRRQERLLERKNQGTQGRTSAAPASRVWVKLAYVMVDLQTDAFEEKLQPRLQDLANMCSDVPPTVAEAAAAPENAVLLAENRAAIAKYTKAKTTPLPADADSPFGAPVDLDDCVVMMTYAQATRRLPRALKLKERHALTVLADVIKKTPFPRLPPLTQKKSTTDSASNNNKPSPPATRRHLSKSQPRVKSGPARKASGSVWSRLAYLIVDVQTDQAKQLAKLPAPLRKDLASLCTVTPSVKEAVTAETSKRLVENREKIAKYVKGKRVPLPDAKSVSSFGVPVDIDDCITVMTYAQTTLKAPRLLKADEARALDRLSLKRTVSDSDDYENVSSALPFVSLFAIVAVAAIAVGYRLRRGVAAAVPTGGDAATYVTLA